MTASDAVDGYSKRHASAMDDVGDVVEKFTGAPRVPGVPPRSGVVIVGVGPPLWIGRLQRRPLLPRRPSSRSHAVPP